MILRKVFFLLALFFTAFLGACSDGDDVEPIWAAKNAFAKGTLIIDALFDKEVNILDVDVVLFDSNGVAIDTVTADPVDQNSSGVYSYFATDEMSFYSPFVKVEIRAEGLHDKTELRFDNYAEMTSLLKVSLSLRQSVLSGRIEYLMESGYSLSDAITKARNEFQGFMLDVVTDEELKMLCRYFVSDSVFYSDFSELRDLYTAGTATDYSFISIRAADEILTEIADSKWKNDSLPFKNWYSASNRLVTKAYRLFSCSHDDEGSVAKIENPLSVYNNHSIVCDSRGFYISQFEGYWRLQVGLELICGPCNYYKNDTLQVGDTVYYCKNFSSTWEKFYDAVGVQNRKLNQILGECELTKRNILRYNGETLYICDYDKERQEFRWISDEWLIDSVYANVKETSAYEEACLLDSAGECGEKRLGEIMKVCGGTYSCQEEGWFKLDSVKISLGICDENKKDSVVRVEGVSFFNYFACDLFTKNVSLDYYKGYGWRETDLWEYYGDKCNSDDSYLSIVNRDSSNYICDGEKFVRIRDQYLVPPAYDKKLCDITTKWQVLEYDSVHYTCNGEGWAQITSESLKTSNVCLSKDKSKIIVVDDVYYQCSGSKWEDMGDWSRDQYLFLQENAHYCDNGIAGTSLVYSSALNLWYACQPKYSSGPEVKFGQISFSPINNYDALKGGKFVDDSIFHVVDGSLTYEYKRRGMTLYAQRVFEGTPSEENYKWDLFVDGKNLFVLGRHGSQKIDLGKEGLSDAVATQFFEDWKKHALTVVGVTSEDRREMTSLEQTSEFSYVNYEDAKKSCPSGFHIPSSEEWMGDAKAIMSLNPDQYLKDYPYIYHVVGVKFDEGSSDYRGVPLYTNIFWSSTSKDENTQYCYEFNNWANTTAGIKTYMIECPKNLNLFVQAMCVKNK